MSNVLIVVEWDILEEAVDKTFLGIMSPLGMTKIEGLNLLDYVEVVEKANMDQLM